MGKKIIIKKGAGLIHYAWWKSGDNEGSKSFRIVSSGIPEFLEAMEKVGVEVVDLDKLEKEMA